MKHIPLSQYLAFKEHRSWYVINPQTLESYKTTLKKIQERKMTIIAVDEIPKVPLYTTSGALSKAGRQAKSNRP